MKKGLIIALCVFVIIAVGVGGLICWQWDNIRAFTYSEEDLKQKNIDTSESLRKEIADYIGEDLRGFTDEELAQIQAGELTASQAVAVILAEQKAKKSKEAAKKQQESKPSMTRDSLAEQYTAQLSALQSKYMGQLQSLVNGAINEYNTSVRAGEEKASAKSRILRSYMGAALSLESSCDGEFYAIMANLEADLKAIGEDTSIVNSLKTSYASEKQSLKASYMNEIK